MTKHIAVLVFPDFQLLDSAGPIAAFEIANQVVRKSYAIHVVASQPGTVTSSSGIAVLATPLPSLTRIDTLIVAGGNGTRRLCQDQALLSFVKRCATRLPRVASVCSGSFVLAAAGLLNGCRATTHWNCADEFRQRFPQVHLDSDKIYIRAGKVWTSAGITAGIDMALALICEDLGESVARKVAQGLVLYYQRPGGQSQFSPLLSLGDPGQRFGKLLAHLRANLAREWPVDEMAAYCALSARHFSRCFTQEVGLPPAKALERLRVDAARAALESGAGSLSVVARQHGFGSTERLRKSLQRLLGATPSAVRRSTMTRV